MATFTPTTKKPNKNNKFFINYKNGGYSVAIARDDSGYTLPNCVGMCQGLLRQLENDKTVWSEIGNYFSGNASTWFANAKKTSKFKTGSTPKLGAIACWGNGNGHVAYVNAIASDGTITVVNSTASGIVFELVKVKPPYAWNNLTFQGFIYPTTDYGTGDYGKTTTTASSTTKSNVQCTYTVVNGDSLWAISQKFLGKGARYKEIMTLNGLKTTLINVGQKLLIPNK